MRQPENDLITARVLLDEMARLQQANCSETVAKLKIVADEILKPYNLTSCLVVDTMEYEIVLAEQAKVA